MYIYWKLFQISAILHFSYGRGIPIRAMEPPPPNLEYEPRKEESRRKRAIKNRLRVGQHHFNKWLNQTTVHGIVHVFKGKSRFRRILWFFIFTIAAIGCFSILTYYIYYWATDPTATTISIEPNTNGQSFPAVTICNLNAVRTTYHDDQNVVEILNMLAKPNTRFLTNCSFSMFNLTCDEMLNRINDTDTNINITDAFIDGSQNREDFILYCGFSGGDSDSDGIVRCEDDFIPVLTPSGICYTFNSAFNERSDRYVKRAGPNYGLKLIVNVSQSEYSLLSSGDVGVTVAVHPRQDLPVLEKGVSTPPGRNGFIAISKVQVSDETTENKCIKDNGQLTFLSQYAYSISACQTNAFLEHIAQDSVCGCVYINRRRPSTRKTPNCNITKACCLLKEYRKFIPSEQQCPPPCDYTVYNIKPSYSQFPSNELANYLAQCYNTTPDDVQSNMLSINVYFEEIETTTMNTGYAYTFANLLADMGGLMGLFIGASVISLLEIGMLVFDFLKSLVFTRTVKTAVKSMENRIKLPEVDIAKPVEDEESENERKPPERILSLAKGTLAF